LYKLHSKILQEAVGGRKAGIRKAGIRKAGIRKAGIRKAGIRKAGIRKTGISINFNVERTLEYLMPCAL